MFPTRWSNFLFVITWIVVIPFARCLAANIPRGTVQAFSTAPKVLQEDISVILKKDLSPDILASSMPVAVTSHNERINSQLENKGFLLRSSSYNISGIDGYALFALPILSSELTEILNTAEADLQSRDGRASTLSYRVNTTKWSFSVLALNSSVQYGSIKAILQRFIKLSIPTPTSNDIITTRVGVLFNGSNAIADINIAPCQIVKNGSFIPFIGHDDGRTVPSSKTIEIVRITPMGSTCEYEFVNETAALAPFQSGGKTSRLRNRQLESEVLARIGQTAFAMTVNLWRRRDGLPVEVKIWALKAIIHVAYWQLIAVTVLTTLELGMTGYDDLSRGFFDSQIGLDTGLYEVGHLTARFVVKILHTASNIESGLFTISAWKEIVAAFLRPLQEMGEYDNGWAMDGKIFGPAANYNISSDTTWETESYNRNAIAVWQIWMGDSDDFDY